MKFAYESLHAHHLGFHFRIKKALGERRSLIRIPQRPESLRLHSTSIFHSLFLPRRRSSRWLRRWVSEESHVELNLHLISYFFESFPQATAAMSVFRLEKDYSSNENVNKLLLEGFIMQINFSFACLSLLGHYDFLRFFSWVHFFAPQWPQEEWMVSLLLKRSKKGKIFLFSDLVRGWKIFFFFPLFIFLKCVTLKSPCAMKKNEY